MRHAFIVVTAVFALLAASPSRAQSLGSLEGFGGVSLGGSTETETLKPNLGGRLAVSLIPNVQVIGEVGKLRNVQSPLADTVFRLTGAGIEASALYGEGGVRFIAAPRSAVTPYAEATAGIARLSVNATGLGFVGNTVLPAAISYLDRTGPIMGAGGGLLMHAGALQIDLGYRFKQISPPDALRAALGFGQNLRSQQVRFGVGVRF